ASLRETLDHAADRRHLSLMIDIRRPAIAFACTLIAPTAAMAQFERLEPRFDALIPRTAAIEVLADGIGWAEGPVWDASDGSLLLSDVVGNVIFRWKEGVGLTRFRERSGYTGTEPFTGREPGSNGLTFDDRGRLVMCQHGDRRVARLNEDGSITVLADRYEGRRFNSPNDLVYGPRGDLYFTDPPFGLPGTFNSPDRELDFTGVFRLAPDGAVSLLIRDLRGPNGIGMSPDGATLYVSSSERGRALWRAYPVRPDGSVGGGREFAEAVGGGPGGADGLKVDIDGNVFATGPGGVHVFAADGTRLGRILTGQPTANVAWGDDGSVLYITANHQLLRVRTTTRGAERPGPGQVKRTRSDSGRDDEVE
ncbi:MAG: SMP-30/gluconolactonase/LRE family protein, partial [Gemmatimonadota bacterium]